MCRRIMKKSLIEKAKRTIEDRRYEAVSKAQDNKIKALNNSVFKMLYYEYIDSMTNDARNGLANTENTKQLEKFCKEWLEKHNIQSINPIYHCTKCNDSGYVDGGYCDCLIEEINNLLKLESGFINLEDFSQANFDLFENKEYMQLLYQKMQKWCSGNFDKTIVFLAGQTGVGKTHLMKCMANELIKKHKLVYLTSSFAMHQDFVKSYATRNLEEKNELINKYLTPEVLFIDDLGTEIRSNREITVNYLYQIINERKMKKLPTVITSNLSIEDVMDYYDERIASRIADQTSSICIYISGKDIRLSKNQ